MSTAQIVRKSFNGGEIAPELHYRSDLEKYHNSCKTMKNVMVTPWGAALRRPPTEQLHKFDTATYGVPVKYLPFRFSLEEVFNIVFTDGSGSASADATTADMIVLDDQGTLQILEGTGTMILSTPYNPLDLDNLHHIQVNDFIYMTCGGLYPEYYILRYFDKTESANRWKIEFNELIGGPFEDLNVIESSTILAKIQNYEATKTYSQGEVVYPSSVITITGGGLDLYGGTSSDKWNRVRVDLSSAYGGNIGDSVEIDGFYISSAGNKNYYIRYFPPPTYNVKYENPVQPGDRIEGTFTITKIDGNSIVIDKTIYSDESSGYAAPVFATDPGANISSIGVDDVYYRSLQNTNIGNALSNASFWEPLDFYEGQVPLVASDEIFASTDIGREVAIVVDRSNQIYGNWDADQSSEIINAQGTMILETSGGAWNGLLELEASYNSGGTWISLGSIRSIDGGYNGSIERTITNPKAIVRVTLSQWAPPSGTFVTEKCQWSLSFSEPVRSFFKITGYTDAQNVVAETLSPLIRNYSDYRWQLGAFSETTGYPNTLTIHEERKVYGGIRSKPNTVWGSTVNDFNNFLLGDLDTSPYTFTIKSDSFDTIRWMRSARQLMIGTDNSESIIGTRDESRVISPTNVHVSTQTYFGSSNIQAVVTADLVFFVQGQKERVRSSQYDFGTDQYLSDEASLLAKHITDSGIKEMSYRRHPFNSIFFVLDNGKAVSFTYERENMVRGWSQIEINNGEFISAASNYSDNGDVIVGIVKRGSLYFLERITETNENTVYLDSQIRFTYAEYQSGITLPWENDIGITVVHDDAELVQGNDYAISGGVLTLVGINSGDIVVGYKYEWCIEPTDFIEFGDFGTTKRPSKVALYLIQSGDCTVEINGNNAPFKEGLALNPTERLNGRYELTCGGGYNHTIGIKLSGNGHKPFYLSAIGMYATKR